MWVSALPRRPVSCLHPSFGCPRSPRPSLPPALVDAWGQASACPPPPHHRSHTVHRRPRGSSGHLLCTIGDCLVYIRLSGCDPELASPFKFLPLGSAHTVHKASQRNAAWKKKNKRGEKKYLRRRKKKNNPNPSQQTVLLPPGSSARVRFSRRSPAAEAQRLVVGTAPTGAAPRGSPHGRAPSARKLSPPPQGSSRPARGRVPAQGHRTAAKTCFYPAFTPRPPRPLRHLPLRSAASPAEPPRGAVRPTGLLLRGDEAVKAPRALSRSLIHIYIYRVGPVEWQLHTCAGGRIASRLPS